MENEFVPYEQALELKQLGFDEVCFGFYNNAIANVYIKQDFNDELREIYKGDFDAPLWQQAFDWFRIEHNLYGDVLWRGDMHTWCFKINDFKDYSHDFSEVDYNTYGEAREACLIKIIKLCKKN